MKAHLMTILLISAIVVCLIGIFTYPIYAAILLTTLLCVASVVLVYWTAYGWINSYFEKQDK